MVLITPFVGIGATHLLPVFLVPASSATEKETIREPGPSRLAKHQQALPRL